MYVGIFSFKSNCCKPYLHLIDLTSSHHDNPWRFLYAGDHLMWHCENALPSASARLREDILNFPLYAPRSCFARVEPRSCLYFLIPRFLWFIKTLVCPTVFTCSMITNWSSRLKMQMKSTIATSGWFSISSRLNSSYTIQAPD